MLRLSPLVWFASLVLSAPLATAQTREAVSGEITLRGTVETVDVAARIVRIRGDQGNVVTVNVPAAATRLNEVRVGDTVTATYYDRVVIRPKPADEPAIERTILPTTVTPGGQALPGGSIANQRMVTVTITGWDAANRVVSFTGPRGESYTRRLLDTTDPSIVAGLKSGDRVDVTWTEAVRVELQPQTVIETLRDRVTVAILWGIDNAFSGNMIREATGRTSTDVPINLSETSQDDVYGRIGLMKISVGYRTSPRSEGVFNFVYANSAAERVQIGTAATSPTAPLNVDFTDYQYWGLEGGQRWFFRRVRFTPFVGYLVGVNRHQDIRGTFVDVPPSATPALAAPDGKFFESSWATSLGPTGGVLFGIGAVEAIIETQLRYVGALSDVEWLVEEGLRDINTGSGRWSIPIQFGVRFRF